MTSYVVLRAGEGLISASTFPERGGWVGWCLILKGFLKSFCLFVCLFLMCPKKRKKKKKKKKKEL